MSICVFSQSFASYSPLAFWVQQLSPQKSDQLLKAVEPLATWLVGNRLNHNPPGWGTARFYVLGQPASVAGRIDSFSSVNPSLPFCLETTELDS